MKGARLVGLAPFIDGSAGALAGGVSGSAVPIDVSLGLPDFPLGLSFHFLGLPLELLARVAGEAANRIPDLATDFLRRALGLVLEAVRAEIVCHGSVLSEWEGRSVRWW